MIRINLNEVEGGEDGGRRVPAQVLLQSLLRVPHRQGQVKARHNLEYSSHGLDLMNLRRIGAGGFGKVYLVARRKDGRLYAAKYQKIKDKRTQRLVGKTYMIYVG